MAMANRIESLEHKHAVLEEALHQEEAHPWVNEAKVLHLKQDKLRIKDELQRLRACGEGQCGDARTG